MVISSVGYDVFCEGANSFIDSEFISIYGNIASNGEIVWKLWVKSFDTSDNDTIEYYVNASSRGLKALSWLKSLELVVDVSKSSIITNLDKEDAKQAVFRAIRDDMVFSDMFNLF